MSTQSVNICFVYTPSFSLCLNPIAMQRGGVFTFYQSADDFVSTVQKRILSLALPWSVQKDNSYADAEKIKAAGFDVILLAPGLRFMFFRNGFDKNSILPVSFNDYTTRNVDNIINQINAALANRVKGMDTA